MNSFKRFNIVYRTVEALYGRAVGELDVRRAYARYIKVTGEEAMA
jgi:hypothetical protein